MPVPAKTEVTFSKWLKHVLSIPFIWMPVVPGILLQVAATIYQATCFRLYGIERVKLMDYIYFDREKLGYLTLFDKINCAYCSYMNGSFAYISEIGRRTEYYWCGVKHRNQPDNPAFAYQAKFATYGSKEDYESHLLSSGRRSLKK